MEINASGNIIDGGYTGELSATSFSGDGSSLTNLVGLPTSLAFSSDGVLSLGRSGGQPNLTIDIDLGQTDSPSFTGLTVTNTIIGNIDSADKWKNPRTLALTGAVSGSQSIDGSGNVSITTTSSPVLTLTGDVSGSTTFTNLGNASLAVTVIDDSHNHVVGNIDSFTENVQDIVGGMVSGNTETGIDITYQDSDGTLDFVLANDPTITLTGAVTGSATMTNLGNVSITTTSSPVLTLTGDATGSTTFTNLGNASLTVTVADDSHSHSNYATHVSSNLTGTPTAPTAVDSTNTTQIATTAFVKSQIGNLIDGAPTTLDTLNELADALGDDPNHATAMTNLIGTKLDKTHDMVLTLNGDVSGAATFTDMANATLTVMVADDSHSHLISNVDGLQSSLDSKLPSSSYTASDVLIKIKTVDGSGSGLDADLLDGYDWGSTNKNVSGSDFSASGNFYVTGSYKGFSSTINNNWIYSRGSTEWAFAGNGGNQVNLSFWSGHENTKFQSIQADNTYLQFLNSGNNVHMRLGSSLIDIWRSTKIHSNLELTGTLSVGVGTNYSYIYMRDGNDGDRVIHCDSDRIGFLAQSGSWGSFCEDDGSWTSVGNVVAYSDGRLKDNIEIIPNAISKIKAIRGVTFTRNDFEDSITKHAGVISQEVEKVLPEVVFSDKDGIQSVAYGNMVGLLIEGIKEQEEVIQLLTKRIKDLEGI